MDPMTVFWAHDQIEVGWKHLVEYCIISFIGLLFLSDELTN